MPEPKEEWQVIIDLLRDTDPVLLNRIGRKMMHYLYKLNIKQIGILMEKLEASTNEIQVEPNQSSNEPLQRIEQNILEQIVEEIFHIASQELPSESITQMVKVWLKDNQARFLSMAAEKRDVALVEISDALHKFCNKKEIVRSISPEENIGIKVALIRRFFNEDLNFINTIKNYLTIDYFSTMLQKTIGPSRGNGKLGGKAAGLVRAATILSSKQNNSISLRNLSLPKTWFLTSDGIIEFLHFNALEEMPNIKYRNPVEIRQEYPYLEQIFKNSSMPPEIIAGLNLALDDLGDQPLVVRSSSLLEDQTGAAFAGKYKSLFVANVGTKQERLEALIDAILEVYASVFGPDPIEYRRERGLLDFNEEMGILIQEVVGRKVGKYFFPAYAGVAFSYNDARWSKRMKREDGMIRLVAGLGTRAVDRVDNDYPMLISPGQPGLRVNVNPQEVLWYSQKNIDVINLITKRFETIPFEKMIREVGYNYPSLNQVVSMFQNGELITPTGNMMNVTEDTPVITFARLLKSGPLVYQVKDMLNILSNELEMPVDIEFACDGDIHKIYLLQCRPQSTAIYHENITIPDDIPQERILFTANQYVTNGYVKGIEYIVYVDPDEYDNLETMDDLLMIGRIIGELNQKLPKQAFILIGPGRWGSRGDIKLGVKVGYSDINNTSMLIEVAKKKKDYMPELSFGTHFFQDLVEAKIKYLPLYIDNKDTIFNEDFFMKSPNVLSRFLPSALKYEGIVKVIPVTRMYENATVEIVLDEDKGEGIAFIQIEEKKPILD